MEYNVEEDFWQKKLEHLIFCTPSKIANTLCSHQAGEHNSIDPNTNTLVNNSSGNIMIHVTFLH